MQEEHGLEQELGAMMGRWIPRRDVPRWFDVRDSQQVKITGERIASCMGQHLNERMTIDVIARESGVSIQDIQEFFTLREIMDDFRTELSFYEENGTIYCILQDDRYSINKFFDTTDAKQDSSMISKAQALKLNRASASMLKVDAIFSAIAGAIFAIACAINMYLIINDVIFYFLIVNPSILSASVSSLAGLLVSTLAFSIMWRIDARSSRAALKKGMRTCFGIDVIIAGIIGCFAWGIGSLYIIKGTVILAGEAYKDNTMKRGAIAALLPIIDGFNASSWLLPVFAGAVGVLSVLASLFDTFMVNGVLDPIILNQSLLTIALSMLGFIVGGVYHARVFHAIKRGQFKAIASVLLGLSIAGLACYGTSVPMLIQSILIFGMEEISRKARIASVQPARAKKPAGNTGNVADQRHEKSISNASMPKPELERAKLTLDFGDESGNDLQATTRSKAGKPERGIELKLLSWREE